jgi:hypothetical protein
MRLAGAPQFCQVVSVVPQFSDHAANERSGWHELNADVREQHRDDILQALGKLSDGMQKWMPTPPSRSLLANSTEAFRVGGHGECGV